MKKFFEKYSIILFSSLVSSFIFLASVLGYVLYKESKKINTEKLMQASVIIYIVAVAIVIGVVLYFVFFNAFSRKHLTTKN